MSQKKNRIAVVLLCCLIGVYIILKTGVLESDTETTPSDYELADSIFTSEKDDIVWMQINNPSGSFSFQKDGDNWICAEKPEIELKQETVNNLAWDYIDLKPNRTIEEQAENLEQYGLEQPQASISLRMKDESEVTFLLGNQSEGGDGYYLMMEHQPTVYLMSSMESNNILCSLDDYRTSELFAFTEETIQKIVYQVGDSTYTVERNGKQWNMKEPYEREVYSIEFSENVITPVLSLKIAEYYDDQSQEQCGLEHPQYSLQVTGADETDTLFIGDKNESGCRYAKWKNKNGIFGISEESLSFFEVSPLTYMQTYVFLPHINTVESFEGTILEQTFAMTIQRNGDETSYYLNGEQVESSVWKEKFQTLLSVEITSLIAETDMSSQTPVVSYTAKLTDGTQRKIAFYSLDERNYAAALDGHVCFSVNKNSIENLIENF